MHPYILCCPQVQRIGTTSKTFSISRVGNSIYFESKMYDFRVQWDVEMKVNISVSINAITPFLCLSSLPLFSLQSRELFQWQKQIIEERAHKILLQNRNTEAKRVYQS